MQKMIEEKRNRERFLPVLAMLAITAQLAAHVLGPRTMLVGPLLLPGGLWCFPITFFLWDIMTEVYGFRKVKQIIWYYLFCQIVFSALIIITLQTKVDPEVQNMQYFSIVLGSVPRITVAMIIAIFLGDYCNCFILQKIKNYTHGKHLWFRLIGATAIGEAIVSIAWTVLFYWHSDVHLNFEKLIVCQYIVKIIFEVLFVPVTYLVVYWLKKHDGPSVVERYINFNPETMRVFSS